MKLNKQKKFNNGDSVHVFPRIVSILLFIAGLPLLFGGIYLIALGGSWYYLLAGIGLSFAAYKLWQGQMVGVRIYLYVFVLTILWALWEVGFAFWPLVPRLVAFIFLAACVLLCAPLLGRQQAPKKSLPFRLSAGVMAVIFVGYLASMFQPHDVISNDLMLTKGQITKATQATNGDWLSYGRTGHGDRYAPFDEINRDNIGKLEVAWQARTGFIADQSKFMQDQTTPIYVDGTLYQCAPAGQISALDGTTGKIKWQYDPKAESSDWKRCRNIAYYDPGPDDSCGPRIVETTVDARLISVRTDNGKPCETFGEGGTVDLWAGMGDTNPEYLTNSSGAIVAGDNIVLGGRVTDNVSLGEPSGVIRAFDAKTGALAWAWDLGNPELTGLPPEGQSYTPGTPNAWAVLSYDVELGMVYVPLGNATPDIFGGDRRAFDDEYSSAVVALDLNTGKEVWKFQTTHHDLWDYDIPAQPVLADIPDGNGGSIPGLIQTTKRSQTFVLDRRTGKPIKAVEEKPAPAGDGTIKGEYYAPTQPYSTQMAAISTQPLTAKSMWGATPLDQMLCRIRFEKLRYDGEFTTPSTHQSIVFPGPLGGMNYGSTAIDQRRNLMVSAVIKFPLINNLVPRAEVTDDMVYSGESGPYAPMKGTPYGMQREPFMSPLMIPCTAPPWGYVAAIDLASGKQVWQQPAGTSKDLAFGQFQPGLAFHVGLPPLGGPMVSKGGIAWYAGTQDFYLRAYDIETGRVIWKGRLPTGSQATPMSYVGKDGRQYVVISAGGARGNQTHWGDYIIAFALPKK